MLHVKQELRRVKAIWVPMQLQHVRKTRGGYFVSDIFFFLLVLAFYVLLCLFVFAFIFQLRELLVWERVVEEEFCWPNCLTSYFLALFEGRIWAAIWTPHRWNEAVVVLVPSRVFSSRHFRKMQLAAFNLDHIRTDKKVTMLVQPLLPNRDFPSGQRRVRGKGTVEFLWWHCSHLNIILKDYSWQI